MKIAVCVLAYNEEKLIERTLNSLLNSPRAKEYEIHVYANGCTDKTFEKVVDFSRFHPNVRAHLIEKASKTNAWNVAFLENKAENIVFCDGDIIAEENAVFKLLDDLNSNPILKISSTRMMPYYSSAPWEKKLVGFMQNPLKHEFLYGGMYIIKRQAILDNLKQIGLTGFPLGITGEDYFLERLIEPNEFSVANVNTLYDPPSMNDYIRYLARVRWQNEQMELILGKHRDHDFKWYQIILRKLFNQKRLSYLFISLPAVTLRTIFKFFKRKEINAAYLKLGPVVKDGDNILTKMTRSNSTK